jgi:ATP-dependent DNA helicase RecQ
LYLSPERLASHVFQDYLREMPVSMLAVDEAHCISQWGYDFRPEYLRIAEVRTLLPDIPVLAVTATATPPVAEDIMDKLQFEGRQLFKKSFSRPNLHYIVQHEQDKLGRLENVIKKIGGSGVVYVRSRRRTEEFAKWLAAKGYSAAAYHAGLRFENREDIQKKWTEGVVQIAVATNAFGMGIDKPDVRWVVHLDIPDNPEAYFQEAGRAGRDEKKAYAVLLYDEADLYDLEERIQKSFPELPYIQRVYKALANFLSLPIGSGINQDFEFDLAAFCRNFSLKAPAVLSALKVLEIEGFMRLSESFHDPSRVMVLLGRSEVYEIQVKANAVSELLIVLLRSYPGVMSQFVAIDEKLLALRTKSTPKEVVDLFTKYRKMGWVDYLPASDKPRITYLTDRVEEQYITLSPALTIKLKERAFERMQAMKNYAQGKHCRSGYLVGYFGEIDAKACGHCDVCLSTRRPTPRAGEWMQTIVDTLKDHPMHEGELITKLGKTKADAIAEALAWLLDMGTLEHRSGRLYLSNSKDATLRK